MRQKKNKPKHQLASEAHISEGPAQVYRGRGWQGWAHFLGVTNDGDTDASKPITIYKVLLVIAKPGTVGAKFIEEHIDRPWLNDPGDILRLLWPIVSYSPDHWWEKELLGNAIALHPSASGYPDYIDVRDAKSMKENEQRMKVAVVNIIAGKSQG